MGTLYHDDPEEPEENSPEKMIKWMQHVHIIIFVGTITSELISSEARVLDRKIRLLELKDKESKDSHSKLA